MILSGKEIQKQVEMGTIKIDPFSQDLINPNSYNLRLHSDLLVYDNKILDMKEKNTASPLKIPDDGLLLEPNTLYLGRTICLLYTSPSPRDKRQSRMPSSA